jgi:hypothetical protein
MDAKKPDAPERQADFEPAPDAWERFEKAMDKVVKAPPQHRTAKPAARPERAHRT